MSKEHKKRKRIVINDQQYQSDHTLPDTDADKSSREIKTDKHDPHANIIRKHRKYGL